MSGNHPLFFIPGLRSQVAGYV